MGLTAALIFLFFHIKYAYCLTNTNTGTGIHFVDDAGRVGLLWSSIGLAVLTSSMQGLITTIVTIAEDQNMWTFRFRIARLEHYWWTSISILLLTSFGLIVMSFLSGNNNDSVGVLALSTATMIAIVRYAVPAWRHRHFIDNRWLAWSGKSRTGITYRFAKVCGTAEKWRELDRKSTSRRAAPPCDEWGPAINPPKGLSADPTAILDGFAEVTPDLIYSKHWELGPCVYDDGLSNTGSVSLLWGEREGFRRRVSRAINSVPSSLLTSRPFTIDGYNGEGLCLAMGVLGRNKGLRPQELMFDFDDSWKKLRGYERANISASTTTMLENTSVWSPRPNKVMRSYYKKAMQDQYGTLPGHFVGAATELALIFLDCDPRAIYTWLKAGHEQQSMEINVDMSRPENAGRGKENSPRATEEQLRILYRAQYASMILSLNYLPSSGHGHLTTRSTGPISRPDLLCFALLYLAEHAVKPKGARFERGEGAPRPEWWTENWVKSRLDSEFHSLQGNWKAQAAWLLGLQQWPPALEDWPAWPDVRYTPSYLE